MPSEHRRQAIYHHFLAPHSRTTDNADALACMLATYYSDGGVMPAGLGLDPEDFTRLVEYHFPGVPLPICRPRPEPQWDPRLAEEKEELEKLMLIYRAGVDPAEVWLSRIVATGCMGSNHLWQDLGLWSRHMLSELLVRNFPELAAKNDRDMKWKKFFYKQLCIQEGIYICRAPSCEQCTDYPNCFGPEE
jgi:nitrogen fixation protein NifQ